MSAASSRDVLRVEHLTMRFGGLVAVHDLSFSARHGDITALIGPNGAGKTTVFNCITGFYKPTSGAISLTHDDGHAIRLERLPKSTFPFGIFSSANVAHYAMARKPRIDAGQSSTGADHCPENARAASAASVDKFACSLCHAYLPSSGCENHRQRRVCLISDRMGSAACVTSVSMTRAAIRPTPLVLRRL